MTKIAARIQHHRLSTKSEIFFKYYNTAKIQEGEGFISPLYHGLGLGGGGGVSLVVGPTVNAATKGLWNGVHIILLHP